MLHIYGGSGGDSALSDPQAARTATTWNASITVHQQAKYIFHSLILSLVISSDLTLASGMLRELKQVET